MLVRYISAKPQISSSCNFLYVSLCCNKKKYSTFPFDKMLVKSDYVVVRFRHTKKTWLEKTSGFGFRTPLLLTSVAGDGLTSCENICFWSLTP